jgi:hypothetical protein
MEENGTSLKRRKAHLLDCAVDLCALQHAFRRAQLRLYLRIARRLCCESLGRGDGTHTLLL